MLRRLEDYPGVHFKKIKTRRGNSYFVVLGPEYRDPRIIGSLEKTLDINIMNIKGESKTAIKLWLNERDFTKLLEWVKSIDTKDTYVDL